MVLPVRKVIIILGLVVNLLLISTMPALADLTNEPAWWGNSNDQTVSLSWYFNSNTNPPAADFAVTPAWYAGETWDIYLVGLGLAPKWYSSVAGRNGLWGYAGESGNNYGVFNVTVDNIDLLPIKHLWFQVEYYLDGGSLISGVGVPPGGYSVNNWQLFDEDLGGGWWRRTGSVDIQPQPPYEKIYLNIGAPPGTTTSVIDQLHISVNAVPEPASMLLLGGGLLGLAGINIRKKKDDSLSS